MCGRLPSTAAEVKRLQQCWGCQSIGDSAGICIGLLRKGSGGQSHPFSGANINVEHKKKVDLGVLRGADHEGRASEAPFSTVLIDSEVRVLIAI